MTKGKRRLDSRAGRSMPSKTAGSDRRRQGAASGSAAEAMVAAARLQSLPVIPSPPFHSHLHGRPPLPGDLHDCRLIALMATDLKCERAVGGSLAKDIGKRRTMTPMTKKIRQKIRRPESEQSEQFYIRRNSVRTNFKI